MPTNRKPSFSSLASLASVAGTFFAAPAAASVVVHPGFTAIFDFNVSNLGPYERVVAVGITPPDQRAPSVSELFADWGRQGLVDSCSSQANPCAVGAFDGTNDGTGLWDGTFSVAYTSLSEPLTVVPEVMIVLKDGGIVNVTRSTVNVVASAPTAALAGLALLAAGACGRTRRLHSMG